MKNIFLTCLTVLCLSLSFFTIISCTEKQSVKESAMLVANSDEAAMIERGAYLVKIMGCNDCHSPKRMGPQGPEIIPELMLSGYPADRPILSISDSLFQKGFAMFYPDLTAAVGPWGMSFAGNLTPDETGIGTWSEEQFIKALTEGKFKGLDNGRNILPPMPVENYRDMRREDVVAIFNYLKSLKPVKNVVPGHIPPNQES